MADPLTINVTQAAASAPVTYTVPASVEVEPLSASARFDGATASGSFLACLSFYSASGLLLARVFPDQRLGIGSDSDVTYAPALNTGDAGASTALGFKLISAASTNGTLVQAGGTVLSWYYISNINSLPRYVKFYNKATAPTVGTDVPVFTLGIPGSAAANVCFTQPVQFSLGLGIGTTTGSADNSTAAVAASEIIVNLGYV